VVGAAVWLSVLVRVVTEGLLCLVAAGQAAGRLGPGCSGTCQGRGRRLSLCNLMYGRDCQNICELWSLANHFDDSKAPVRAQIVVCFVAQSIQDLKPSPAPLPPCT
jgi:hypothetical protein